MDREGRARVMCKSPARSLEPGGREPAPGDWDEAPSGAPFHHGGPDGQERGLWAWSPRVTPSSTTCTAQPGRLAWEPCVSQDVIVGTPEPRPAPSLINPRQVWGRGALGLDSGRVAGSPRTA